MDDDITDFNTDATEAAKIWAESLQLEMEFGVRRHKLILALLKGIEDNAS